MKDLHLKEFVAKDFMGIDQSSPVIIDFTAKGKNVIKLTGNQGAGKTSTMTALMYLMGAAFNFDQKNFKNITDDALNVNLDFEYEKEKYTVTATGNRLVLKKFFKEADKFISVNEPKMMLRKIFGNLGVSPMFLKELSGKKQIQWFKDTFGDDPKINKKEDELVSAIDDLTEKRRDANRDAKALDGSLKTEPLYENYEANLVKFKTAPSAKKEKERFDELSELNTKFTRSKDGLDNLKKELSNKNSEIEELKKELAAAEHSAVAISKRIDDGKVWLDENKGVPEQYEAAKEEWMNVSKKLADYDKWKSVLKKEKELNELQEASQMADTMLDQLRKELLELTGKYLPKIKGLEVRVKTSMTDDEEGIYYNGKTIAQLSESEAWALFTEIYKDKGVQFVFCENVNSLGSDAVATLNRLAKEGAKIFATEMDRSKNSMEISITTKID